MHMPAHGHPPFVQHDVEQLHGRVLDVVGGENADPACLFVLVEDDVGDVRQSAFVVFGFEA